LRTCREGHGAKSAAYFLAIGEHDLNDTPDRPAILDWHYSDANLIPRLHGLFRPTIVDHVRRIAGLGKPMFDVTLVVCDVEPQNAMRIGPEPFDHCSLHGNFFRRVERCAAMMCNEWNTEEQKANNS
jgi:hypothetical protein